MKTKDKPQVQRFIETARAAGCDESEAAFEAKLKAIAKAPVKPPQKLAPKRRKPAR